MKTLYILSLVTVAQAAWYDINNNVIPGGSANSPSVHWPAVNRSQVEWSGAMTYSQFPVTLIKTWTGDVPPANAPAYGIMHPNCWADITDPVQTARVYGNATFGFPDFFITTERYADVVQSVRRVPTLAIKGVTFSSMNSTALAVVELAHTVEEVLSRNFTFYNVARDFPAVNSTLTGISYWNPILGERVRRLSTGKFLETMVSVTADTGAYSSYFPFKHSVNYYYEGSPVFDENRNLLGISILLDAQNNIGSTFFDLPACFNEQGIWEFGRVGCLRSWKFKVYQLFGYVLPGLDQECIGKNRCQDRLQAPIFPPANSTNSTAAVDLSNIFVGAVGSGNQNEEVVAVKAGASALTTGLTLVAAMVVAAML